MSVNMDNDQVSVDVGEAPYADHEHVNLSFNGTTSNSDGADEFVSLDPLAEELDSNEVAELVLYDRDLNIDGGLFEFGVGINTADNQFLEQAAGNQTTDFQSNEFNLVLYEEPGIIDFVQLGEATDPNRARAQRSINYRERYSSGLFVDSTDDLSVHLESSNQSGSSQKYDGNVQLVYRTVEVAQGIPQFADPRRLMD